MRDRRKIYIVIAAVSIVALEWLYFDMAKHNPQTDIADNSKWRQEDNKEQEDRRLRKEPENWSAEAVYLGVYRYGEDGVDRDHMDEFWYRFEIGGQEKLLQIDNGRADAEGNYDYPIQNVLKEGYSYEITAADQTVTRAEELAVEQKTAWQPPVSGIAGEHTLKNFLATALEPVGTTLYVYGGGWNWQDAGASVQAASIGVSPDWVRFFDSQDENYTYRDRDGDEAKKNPSESYYPYGGYNEYYYAGLDCSGFVSWALYNTVYKESGQRGFVGSSTELAAGLAGRGWGEWTQKAGLYGKEGSAGMKPGDIVSINGHVWISLGSCPDGSVVIVHSTPNKSRTGQPGGGVQIGAVGYSENCEAYQLAEQYMSACYPKWFQRYPAALRSPEVYLSFEGDTAGRFRWDTSGNGGVLTDPDGCQKMDAAQVLELLYGIEFR